jgi:pimeloyl-ACP methyl ester carboxylesterase
MPYLRRPAATLFFDEVGRGTPVVTTHGYLENGSYWGRTGVSAALANAGFRVIDLDLRGHGRSTPEDSDPGYTVEHLADDIGALADALDLPRFHLLTHAMGGMAGLRFAMDHGQRLLSLVSTDTASATFPIDEYCDPKWEVEAFPSDLTVPGAGIFAEFLCQHRSAKEVLDSLRQQPEGHLLAPYFNRFDQNEDPQRCWRWVEEIYAVNNLEHCGAFACSFFSDADPQIARLKGIRCPSLVVVGEHDELLRKPSDLVAQSIPGAKLQVLEGLGHMIAIEDPHRTIRVVRDFLVSVT